MSKNGEFCVKNTVIKTHVEFKHYLIRSSSQDLIIILSF